MTNGKRDDEGGGFGSHLPLIISTTVVMLSVMAGFWSLADPRADLKAIRDNYLTIREHAEFTERYRTTITRIENRDDELSRIKADKDDIQQLANSLDSRFRGVGDARMRELDGIQKRLEELEQRLSAINERINNHIEKDADRFKSAGEKK